MLRYFKKDPKIKHNIGSRALLVSTCFLLYLFMVLLPCYYVLHDVGQEASNNLSLYDAAGAAVGFGAY